MAAPLYAEADWQDALHIKLIQLMNSPQLKNTVGRLTLWQFQQQKWLDELLLLNEPLAKEALSKAEGAEFLKLTGLRARYYAKGIELLPPCRLRVRVAEIPGKGRRLVATRDIKAGECLAAYPFDSADEEAEGGNPLYLAHLVTDSFELRLAGDEILDRSWLPKAWSYYFHSTMACNAGLIGTAPIMLMAFRPIAAGEEVTASYGPGKWICLDHPCFEAASDGFLNLTESWGEANHPEQFKQLREVQARNKELMAALQRKCSC